MQAADANKSSSRLLAATRGVRAPVAGGRCLAVPWLPAAPTPAGAGSAGDSAGLASSQRLTQSTMLVEQRIRDFKNNALPLMM